MYSCLKTQLSICGFPSYVADTFVWFRLREEDKISCGCPTMAVLKKKNHIYIMYNMLFVTDHRLCSIYVFNKINNNKNLTPPPQPPHINKQTKKKSKIIITKQKICGKYNLEWNLCNRPLRWFYKLLLWLFLSVAASENIWRFRNVL